MFKAHMLGAYALSLAAQGAAFDSEELGIIELEANLGDVEKPLELPEGLYTAEIQDVQIGTSQKGNRYFAVKFHVSPDEIGPELADQFEDGAVLFYNRVIVPDGKDRRALFNLRKFLEAIGIDTNTTAIDPNEWMGCPARIRVKHSTYQGETRAEIKSIESAEAKAPVEKAKGRGRK
jgi:hypothetical protein